MTRKEKCLEVLRKYCKNKGIKYEELSDDDCLKSSSVGIAMEYLGLIKSQEIMNYVSLRNGIVSIEENLKINTFRDLLDSLPEEE